MRLITIAVVLVLVATVSARSQEPEVRSVQFPAPMRPWDIAGTVGGTVTILPRPIAEEEIRQVPMLDAAIRMGLPWGFSAIAGASSNVLTNSAHLALQWSWSVGKYSVAIGDRQMVWYGTAPIEGFDASSFGWINYPYVNFGADYTELRVLARAELISVLYRSSRIGREEVALERTPNAGAAFTLAVEQPFVGTTDVLVGIRLNITNSAVQSWLAFTTLRDKLFFPEILFTVSL